MTLAALETLVAVLSVVATVLHYQGAKKFNRITMFHVWHSLFSTWLAIREGLSGATYIDALSKNPLGGIGSCKNYQALMIWQWLPLHLTFAVSIYYFFAHFDKVFTRQRTFGRRGRQRIGVYVAYGLFVTVYNVVIGSTKYSNHDVCVFSVNTCQTSSLATLHAIFFIELVFLTWNFWKVSMSNAQGSVRSIKMPFRLACCIIIAATTFTGIITRLTVTINSIYYGIVNTSAIWADFEGVLAPSGFLLFFLWNRHYLQDNTIDITVDEDDEDQDEFDVNNDVFFPTLRETELRPTRYTSSPLAKKHRESAKIDVSGKTAREIRRAFVLVLPQQSTFRLRALLNAPERIFIQEDLRPPDSTAQVVRLFIAGIALPVAETHRKQHKAESSSLLERYQVSDAKGRLRGGSGGSDDAMAALEKQTQYEDLKEQVQLLSMGVTDWVSALQTMLELLPSDVTTSRDDIGVRDGWRRFKPSSAKSVKGVAMWPTNLQISSARVLAPEMRPLELTTITYGAPSAHAFGFKHGGWLEAEKKLRAAGSASSRLGSKIASVTKFARDISTRVKGSRTRSDGAIGDEVGDNDDEQGEAAPPTAQDELAQLRLKFDISGRSCVCMCQALAATVAAAVHKLSECVVRRDRDLLRQMVAIGLLVHEVSLLSTYGKENGMIGDMSTALSQLNLTLRIVCSRNQDSNEEAPSSVPSPPTAIFSPRDDPPPPPEGIFQVTSVRSLPQRESGSLQGASAPVPSAASALVVGRKVVTLEVKSKEVFSWLRGQVASDLLDEEADAFSWFMEASDTRDAVKIEVHPVMLTLGVNEMQSVANATGDTSLQSDINRKGLQGLRQYMEAFSDFRRREKRRSNPPSPERAGTLHYRGTNFDVVDEDSGDVDSTVRSCTKHLSSLEKLVADESSTLKKNVQLLMASCYVTRLLKGVRTTSCKSAKDRTSMFGTLELVRLMEKRGLVPTSRRGRDPTTSSSSSSTSDASSDRGRGSGLGLTSENVLGLLRGVNGVRLQNCKDNIGAALFSFNKVQVAALPKEMQPPPSTFGGSGKA